MMPRIGPAESPVLERTFYKKYQIVQSKSALHWGLLNLVAVSVVYLDLFNGTVRAYFELDYPILWYVEVVLAAVLTLNVLSDLLLYVGPLSANPVELSPMQLKLLRVKENEPGFKVLKEDKSSSKPNQGLTFSPGSYSTHSHHSSLAGSTPRQLSPGGALTPTRFTPPGSLGSRTPSPGHPPSRTPSPLHSRASPYPLNYSHGSHYSSGSSTHPSSHSGSFLNTSSLLDQSHSFSASFNKSGTASPLSTTNTLSPLFRDGADTSGLRSRSLNMSWTYSPLRDDDRITDLKALEKFMKEQEERDKKLASPDTSSNGGASFWNYGRSLTDYTPVLRKYKYQIACRSPQSTKSPDNDPDDPRTRAGEVWSKLHVFKDEVDGWVENLRKWLSQTVISRVVFEMNKINRDLDRLGSDDVKIGEVTISTLKQLAVTKGQHLSTLNNLISFLEISPNQEYLVKRIYELGEGGCMPAFKWNGGGEFKNKPWEDYLPTDCEIVMHMFCTYMDFQLPPMPKYPDGKTFTSQHFRKVPDKPGTNKTEMLIYQSKVHPPHYRVIVGDTVWDLPKGRNNMFQAILLFLYQVKHKHNGMLGRINLGLSGINILWVLDTN